MCEEDDCCQKDDCCAGMCHSKGASAFLISTSVNIPYHCENHEELRMSVSIVETSIGCYP